MCIQDLTDNELVLQIVEDKSSDAMEELVKRHKDLYYSICHKYNKRYPNLILSDLLNDIYYVFYKSVVSYKPSKNTKFSTWMAHMTRFNCLRTNSEIHNLVPIDEVIESSIPVNKDDDVHSFENKELQKFIFNHLKKLDDKRIHKIFFLKFIEGNKGNKTMSFADIGKIMGLSFSHVINLYKKGQKSIKTKLEQNKNKYE